MRAIWAKLATFALSLGLALSGGCMADLEPADDGSATPLKVGETRTIELRYLRFDVSNFEQALTREDVLALPEAVKAKLWLLDLDLSNGPDAPRLLDNALAAIKALDPEQLSQPARNLQALLKMTPTTANLKGTSLEQLTALSPLLGISSEQVLADMLGVNVDDTFLKPAVISETILKQVIATHPSAQTRPGPRTPDNPSGIYPVKPGFLPVTLADAVADFGTLSAKYGPVDSGGVRHPGFIVGETRAKVFGDDFVMKVKANANALPYKGLDLALGDVASVNSVPSQIGQLFDFEDPNWLTIEGLIEGTPVIEKLTFKVVESPDYVAGGKSPLPKGQGDSPAWALAPYTLERVLAGSAQQAFGDFSTKLAYKQPGHDEALFSATIDKGWQTIFVQGGVGSPPSPSYLWDVLLEVAQVRLHDGGLKEGEANVEFTLENVSVGIDTSSITETIKDNLRADPAGLLDVATRLIDTSSGAADCYYYRANPTNSVERQGDWLYFITESDIKRDDDGKPVRDYAYTSPGFYTDQALTEKVSTKVLLDGDSEHEKVKLREGDTLYAQGKKEGTVFKIAVGGKPGQNRRIVSLTRVK